MDYSFHSFLKIQRDPTSLIKPYEEKWGVGGVVLSNSYLIQEIKYDHNPKINLMQGRDLTKFFKKEWESGSGREK